MPSGCWRAPRPEWLQAGTIAGHRVRDAVQWHPATPLRGAGRRVRDASHRRAEYQRPESLELALGLLHQRDAHVLGIRQQQVLVVAGAFLPALHHFLDADLAGADVLGGEPRVEAAALDAIPRIGAVGAVVGDAVPLCEILRVSLGRIRQLGVELQRPQALLLAVGIDQIAGALGLELGLAVVPVGQRTGGRLLEGALGRLIQRRDLRSGRRTHDRRLAAETRRALALH